jgi:hypothetical protein
MQASARGDGSGFGRVRNTAVRVRGFAILRHINSFLYYATLTSLLFALEFCMNVEVVIFMPVKNLPASRRTLLHRDLNRYRE